MVLVSIAVLVVFLTGALVTRSALIGTALSAIPIAIILFYNRPRTALVVWLLSFAFVPIWIGIRVLGFVPVLSLVAVLALIATTGNKKWSFSKIDLVIIGMIVLGFLGVQFSTSSQSVWLSMITQWGLSYLAGKALIHEVGIQFTNGAFAIIFSLVGLLAIFEFIANWHPFVGLASDNSLYTLWSPIQIRGGQSRSEWAFGHSIALGGALCMAIPFIMATNTKALNKATMLLAVFGGIAVTFSRASLLAGGITLLLSILLLTGITRRQKIGMFFLIGVASAVALPTIGGVFDAAGTEASDSSEYRGRLLELIGTLIPIGRSPIAQVSQDGSVTYLGFGSIDNSFLELGLGFGWMVMTLALVPFVILTFRAIKRRSSVAEIALLGQVPIVVSLAMITQWQSMLWMLGGFSVAIASIKAKPTSQVEYDSVHFEDA
jgi:hypothetical protein